MQNQELESGHTRGGVNRMMIKMFRVLGKRGRVTIPYEIRQRVGFQYNDILSFTESADGRTVVVRREKICDDCKSMQPATTEDEVTLFDFLNSLSEDQQQAALLHLSVKWAERQSGGESGASKNLSD